MRINRLDGVRAIAAVMMILFQHSFLDLAWTGTELFFVLSGFLMTRILTASRTDVSYWSRFYAKRGIRIVPVMLLMLVVTKIASSHLSFVGLAGYGLFMGDVVSVLGYAGGSLGILWTIAVGAHFVAFWSVGVRFLSRKTLICIALGMLALEPLLRFLLSPQIHHYETFSSTPFHLDSIVAGSLLALLVEDSPARRYLARWSGLVSAILTVCFVGISHAFPWFIRVTNAPVYNSLGYAAVSWIYFFFLAWVFFLPEGSPADRVLSWTPLLYVAKISYGLALVHPFIIAILKRVLHLPFGVEGEAANRKIFPIAIVISVSICVLLLRFVERPMHAWGERIERRLRARHGDPPGNEEELVVVA